ncbi:MAG: hypothetical protein QM758_17210 [Armatimonas sp.]
MAISASDEEGEWELEEVETTRMEFPGFAELPNVDELVTLAQTVDSLLIQVPATVTVLENGERDDPTTRKLQEFVDALIPRLPTHKIGDSAFLPDQNALPAARRNKEGSQLVGHSRFSMRRVVTNQALEEHLDLLVLATTEYRRRANALMRRLARQLEVEPSEFSATIDWHRHEQVGRLHGEDWEGDQWGYFFHGIDCGFQNIRTGVTIEARLSFGPLSGDDFGVFDPGFFLKFINDSARVDSVYRPLAALLSDYWENARLALEFLTRHGVLRYMTSEATFGGGWVVDSDAQGTTAE